MIHIFWKFGRRGLFALSLIALALPALAGPSDNVQLRITVENNQADAGSLVFGPVFFGFHDGSFDPFNVGDPGTEVVGSPTPFGQAVVNSYNNFNDLQNLFAASSPTGESVAFANSARGGTTAQNGGEFRPQERDSFSVVVDISQNNQLFIYTRVLPSNDAFAATDTSLSLANIATQGSITFTIFASNIFDAAAINQNPDTADYVQDPGSVARGFADGAQIAPVEDVRIGYFNQFGQVVLLSGEVFNPPDLGIRDFILGTITIEFIAVVAEPGALGISFIGLIGLCIARKRQKKRVPSKVANSFSNLTL